MNYRQLLFDFSNEFDQFIKDNYLIDLSAFLNDHSFKNNEII